MIGNKYNELSKKIIGAAIEVHRTLGPGLLESTYQKCLVQELTIQNLYIETEKEIAVHYKGINLDCGYRADIIVEHKIILELKSVSSLTNIHEAQIMSYMRLANIKKGLLINFNVRLLKEGLKSFVL